MTMTLEPCPFCGSADVEAYPADRERTRWNVCCGNPGCVTRGDNDYLLRSDAIAAWNRRAHLTQPAQSVDVAGAIRKGFMTAESCGPDNRYVLSIKFGSLDDLQAAHNALVGLTAALQEKGNG